MKTLQEISEKWENKADVGHGDKGTTHSYIPEYERLLSPYRNKDINFLEIGVAYGESLEMWYEYFSNNSKIYGIDNQTQEIAPYLNDKRFDIFITDQTSPLLTPYYENVKFDIIIDDGSHMFNHQKESFHLLKHHMNKGGTYIIEDVNSLDQRKEEFLHLKGVSWDCEIIDLREEKGRHDDVLIAYKF
tara:strand:+ start:726 stop:1289 length:564 start_codon:yes stop_codon:yes gene_type:complete